MITGVLLLMKTPVEDGDVPVVRIDELLVPFPYGAPLVEMLEENPVDAMEEVALMPVGTLIVLFENSDELEDEGEVPVVRIPVGPRVIVPLVLLPYGAELVELLEEKPDDGIEEVPLAVLVETLRVLSVDPTALVEIGAVPVVRGPVGPRCSELVVPLPYGGPLLEVVTVRFAVFELEMVVLLALEVEMVVLLVLDVETVVLLALETAEDETPVESGTVGPREIVLLVPLP